MVVFFLTGKIEPRLALGENGFLIKSLWVTRTLSMTFGRPCTIPESYVKVEMPLKDMQVLSSTPESTSYPNLDGWFFTAAM